MLCRRWAAASFTPILLDSQRPNNNQTTDSDLVQCCLHLINIEVVHDSRQKWTTLCRRHFQIQFKGMYLLLDQSFVSLKFVHTDSTDDKLALD